MLGLDLKQNELFSYTTLEQRIPNDFRRVYFASGSMHSADGFSIGV
jgi:hypothetical protein